MTISSVGLSKNVRSHDGKEFPAGKTYAGFPWHSAMQLTSLSHSAIHSCSFVGATEVAAAAGDELEDWAAATATRPSERMAVNFMVAVLEFVGENKE